MKKTKLVASCLAVGIFAISASVQAASRVTTVTAVPLGERIDLNDTTRTAGANLVYSNIVPGGFFFPMQPPDLETQLLQGISDDMILAPGNARELISYTQCYHQRSAEGPQGFTVHMSLQEDDGSGAASLPVDALNAIEGASCSISDIHGLGGDAEIRPDQCLAVCIPNKAGDSGIIIGDKVWLKVIAEGGCIGANQALPGCTEPAVGFFGPGIILTADGDSATVGSTESTLAQSIGDLQGLIDFGGPGMAAEAAAGVPAPVPTVSEWGMVLIAMLVLTGGTIVLRRTRRSAATA